MKFSQVPLSSLFPSKLNPRKRFDTEEDFSLQASIKKQGIIEPIIARVTDKANSYEIICGGRRYHAALRLAKTNGSPAKTKVPVIIRKLTDDQAYDLMTIENLQRKNLTKLEEAKGFKDYITRNKNKKGAIADLADRLSLKEGYIRKRATIMDLPSKVLTAWDSGQLAFGHLEQFIRLQDPYLQGQAIETTIKSALPVSRLKYHIDSLSPNLKSALFSRKAAKCSSCHHNTEKQKNLFDIDESKEPQCLNPVCFEDFTRKFLTKDFKKTEAYIKHKTNGFRLYKDIDSFETMWPAEIDDECKKCKNFVSIFDTVGHRNQPIACLKSSCYRSKRKVQSQPAKKKAKGAPRVEWHGDYFREKFYKERIPEIIENNLKPDDEVTLRLAVFSIINGHRFLHTWFARKFGIEKKRINEMEEGDEYYFYLEGKKIFEPLVKLKAKDLKALMKEATSIMIVNKDFSVKNRQLVAQHLDIDLKKEWTPDQEYFDKKHKPEILEIGHHFKIFAQKPVKDYLSEKLGKQPSQIENLKKGELVELFLKSGADLTGVVPQEIWKI